LSTRPTPPSRFASDDVEGLCGVLEWLYGPDDGRQRFDDAIHTLETMLKLPREKVDAACITLTRAIYEFAGERFGQRLASGGAVRVRKLKGQLHAFDKWYRQAFEPPRRTRGVPTRTAVREMSARIAALLKFLDDDPFLSAERLRRGARGRGGRTNVHAREAHARLAKLGIKTLDRYELLQTVGVSDTYGASEN
jgi:hypothetical protein